jgi:transposase
MAGAVIERRVMMQWSSVPVYVHRLPVDFRKSINGLVVIVQEAMGVSPFSPSLFVFGNQGRDKIKILYWDKNGFCLWYKRLEKDKFKWPRVGSDTVLPLSSEQFSWLLRGLDIAKLTPHAEKHFSLAS